MPTMDTGAPGRLPSWRPAHPRAALSAAVRRYRALVETISRPARRVGAICDLRRLFGHIPWPRARVYLAVHLRGGLIERREPPQRGGDGLLPLAVFGLLLLALWGLALGLTGSP
jgi:hypothetical protein